MSLLRIVLFLAASAALGCAAAIPVLLARLRRRTGFSFDATGASRTLASDTGAAASVLLRDQTLGICGKPDYLLETEVNGLTVLVPVEVKPTRRGARLYDSDRVQIGTYLLALRSMFPERASQHGYVRYAQRTFDIVLTPELELEISRLAESLRRGREAPVLHRSHNIRTRCRACAVREHCDESLAD